MAVLACIGGHVGSIVARILTGICGGIIVAVINRQTATLQGPGLWLLLAGVFAVVFAAVGILEKRLARKPVQPMVPEQDVGSDNRADGIQEIDISGEAAAAKAGSVGSRNATKSDQKIIIR